MGLWADYAKGAAAQATFANPKTAEAKNPNDKNAGKREYRTGIMNAALSRIAEADDNGDGFISFDEYVKGHKEAVDTATGHDAPIKTDDDFVDFCNKQYDANKMQREDFKNLDINGDGFLDKFEISNELNLLDSLSSEDNLPDGTINQRGRERLYGNPENTQEKIGAMLRRNYENFSKGWSDYFNDYQTVKPNVTQATLEVTNEEADFISPISRQVQALDYDDDDPVYLNAPEVIYMREPVSRTPKYSQVVILPDYADDFYSRNDVIRNRIIESIRNIIIEILNMIQFIYQR